MWVYWEVVEEISIHVWCLFILSLIYDLRIQDFNTFVWAWFPSSLTYLHDWINITIHQTCFSYFFKLCFLSSLFSASVITFYFPLIYYLFIYFYSFLKLFSVLCLGHFFILYTTVASSSVCCMNPFWVHDGLRGVHCTFKGVIKTHIFY